MVKHGLITSFINFIIQVVKALGFDQFILEGGILIFFIERPVTAFWLEDEGGRSRIGTFSSSESTNDEIRLG